MLYKPQIGPEHRKLIDWYKKVRENVAGISMPAVITIPEKPQLSLPTIRRQPWEEIVLATSSVLSSGKVTLESIVERRRKPEVVVVRDTAIYVMKEELKLGGEPMSFAEIGKRLGGRDHATILHSWRKIDAQLGSNEALRGTIENIRVLYALKK